MTRFVAVTTCHERGWKLYGQRMASTFSVLWPADIPLHVYAEGFTPDERHVPARRVHRLPLWQEHFKARHSRKPTMCGLRPGLPYDLLHDVVRFSHKVGAVVDMAEEVMRFEELIGNVYDVLIWIDADTFTHSPVSLEFVEALADWSDTALAWLNRAKKYPECGFVMFNLRHPGVPTLLNVWKSFYARDLFYGLPDWTDCHTLQAAVEMTQAPWASLSGGYTSLGHPFVNGPLGAVMDHLKGDRKSVGHSRRQDLRKHRTEDYWRGVR